MENIVRSLSQSVDLLLDPWWLLLVGAILVFRAGRRFLGLRRDRLLSLDLRETSGPRSPPGPGREPRAPAASLSGDDRSELAQRAMERVARCEVAELARRLPILASIAATALDLGVFATMVGIVNSTQGMTTDGRPGFGAMLAGMTESFVTLSLGLLVALHALVAYLFLLGRLRHLEDELASAAPELLGRARSEVPAADLPRGPPGRKMHQRFPPLRLRDSGPLPDVLPASARWIHRLQDAPVAALLLITLMAAWGLPRHPFGWYDGIDVNLPETLRPERLLAVENVTRIAIKADGQRFIGPDWVPSEHFDERLRELRASNPETQVRIEADRFLPYSDVEDVIRSLRAAGFVHVAFMTFKQGSGRSPWSW